MDATEPSETYPYKMGFLPPKFAKKAESELHEKPGIIDDAIEQVKDFLRREDGVEEEWFSDEVIIIFLRWRKFDIHRTCSSIKRMVEYVKRHPKYFVPIAPDIMDEMARSDMIAVLPYRGIDGSMLCYIKLRNWNPSRFTYGAVVNLGVMVFLNALYDPMTQVNGIKVIYDFKGSLMRYVRYITPFILHELYQLLFNCIPMRIKEAHAVNPNGVAKLALPIIKVFVPEKIRSRLTIHNDQAQLLERLQANVVPREYGGQVALSNEWNDSWIKELSVPSYIKAILDSLEPSNETRTS